MEEDYLVAETLVTSVELNDSVQHAHEGKAKKKEEPTPIDLGQPLTSFRKPTSKMTDHLRPMFIKAHLERVPFTKMMVDEGAAINILPAKHLHKLRQTKEELISIETTVFDFVGGVNKTYGILPVKITVGDNH